MFHLWDGFLMPSKWEVREDAVWRVRGPGPRLHPPGTLRSWRDSISAELRATGGDLRLRKALVR
jgi:hypothetical protein